MQIGRKKMALDHLIVQTMEDHEEGGTDVKSILTHGAQALFEGNQREIKCLFTSLPLTNTSIDEQTPDSEADIADLITKTEEAKEEVEEAKEGAFSFSFAKVWTAERAALAEMEDEPTEEEETFADTMAKIEMEREKDKATEVSGRGVRRKAARAVKVRSCTIQRRPTLMAMPVIWRR
jgi:chromodomain-helicase-DNA-binding protein 4